MVSVVLFDALHTLVTPRLPIATQYSLTFEPYLGRFPPNVVQKSFTSALKEVQAEKSAYSGPGLAGKWWSEVTYRTAVGAGAEPTRVEKALPHIVPALLRRFSSREGYKLFDDVLPTLQILRKRKVKLGVVSNTDLRMKSVLDDLHITMFFQAMSFSEEEGVEKPDPLIFLRTLEKMGYGGPRSNVIHVGDSYDNDYIGARQAGLIALFLQREALPSKSEETKRIVPPERTIESLSKLPDFLTIPP